MFRNALNFCLPAVVIASIVLADLQAQTDQEPDKKDQSTQTPSKSKYWTKQRQAEYSKRRLDASTWNMASFREDLAALKAHPWPTKTALSNFPSPVPKYSNFGGALTSRSLQIGDRKIAGTLVAWGKHEVNEHLVADRTHERIAYLNIFILTDLPDPQDSKKHIVSRNFPHILSTGKQKTSVGEVDWLHTGLADGNNYAFINQRIFDLNFGKTILVAPQKDGSLRFMQMESPASYLRRDHKAFVDRVAKSIEADRQAIDFFANENTIGEE